MAERLIADSNGFIAVDGVGTTTLEGLAYVGHPARGGVPLLGVVFILRHADGCQEQTPILGLKPDLVAALVAEIMHRAKAMGLGPMISAAIDQHAREVKDWVRDNPEQEAAVGAFCGGCDTKVNVIDGIATVDHKPDCPVLLRGGQS